MQRLSDEGLLARLRELAGGHRAITAELVSALAELENRRGYLSLGYSSLFDYVNRALRFSRDQAYRLGQAARAAEKRPELIDDLRSGRMSVSSIIPLASHVEVPGLVDACRDKPSREVARIVAETVGARRNRPIGMKAVAGGRVVLTIEISEELASMLEETRELLSHSLSGTREAQLEEVLERAVTQLRKRAETRRFGAAVKRGSRKAPANADAEIRSAANTNGDADSAPKTRDASKSNPAGSGESLIRSAAKLPSGSREHIPAEIRRRVVDEGRNQCEFVGANGTRCSAHGYLQVDHVHSRRRGGGDEPENLRLLCAAHNRHRAREEERLRGDLLAAMTGMGFSRRESKAAMERVLQRNTDTRLEPLIAEMLGEFGSPAAIHGAA